MSDGIDDGAAESGCAGVFAVTCAGLMNLSCGVETPGSLYDLINSYHVPLPIGVIPLYTIDCVIWYQQP